MRIDFKTQRDAEEGFLGLGVRQLENIRANLLLNFDKLIHLFFINLVN
ncbi:hypothetical protein NOS3756_10020 [Nostoc sp. NIES-3756]|jgi:hypothetical protein|nr:hypothetical protein NOS3756_10020 [Nostoc sp. NIES-3756]